MVGPMAGDIEASCAICGAPPFPAECPHEGERLELALTQAMERWVGFHTIRWVVCVKWLALVPLLTCADYSKWVLDHARNQIINTFNALRTMRMEAHDNYLRSLPYYTLYHRYNGQPPLQPAQLQLIHSQIQHANIILQQGVDQDWRTSCLRYPEVLDYYFNLILFELPSERDSTITDPRFGTPKENGARKIKEKRGSVDTRDLQVKEHRKRERRRSRGGGTPPPAPMAPGYRR